jgi:hypothetical protein
MEQRTTHGLRCDLANARETLQAMAERIDHMSAQLSKAVGLLRRGHQGDGDAVEKINDHEVLGKVPRWDEWREDAREWLRDTRDFLRDYNAGQTQGPSGEPKP